MKFVGAFTSTTWRATQLSTKISKSHTESSDLLAVLNQLNPDALPNGRVGLLGLDTDLLENDALGVRRTTEGRRLVNGTQMALLEGEIGPPVLTAVVAQLARSVESSWLSLTHDCYTNKETSVSDTNNKLFVVRYSCV